MILIKLSILFFPFFLYAAEVEGIAITLDSKLETIENVAELVKLKRLHETGQNKECLSSAAKAERALPQVHAWITYTKLLCAKNEYLKNKKMKTELTLLINSAWGNSEELLFGASARRLRAELVELTLLALSEDYKLNKEQAWAFIAKLLEVKDWLGSKQTARLYSIAGELSYAQSNFLKARDYFEKSLLIESNKAVNVRLHAVLKKIDPKFIVSESIVSDISQIESTKEELEIYDRMWIAIKTGDLIAAAEDGVKIIQNFPGGRKAEVSSREVLNIYLEISNNSEEKLQNLKDRVLSEMRKVDGQRQLDWAQTLYFRENYSESFILAKNSLEKISGQPISTQALMLAALSAHNMSDFKSAYTFYEEIVKAHAGTKTAAEALYRLGLLDFRSEKYAEAAARFEKFLQLQHSDDFELSSLYWLWRSQQNIAPKESIRYAEKLIARYPISYYGLRAKAELNSNKLKIIKSLVKKPTWTFNLSEDANWQRFLILKKANWLNEAKVELGSIEEPESAEGKLILAFLWSEISDYYRAAEVLSRAYSEDPSLVAQETIKFAYPLIYKEEIKAETKRYKLPIELVYSLIKQESSFRIDVKSPAGALGLMQLMPATAREVAKDMRIQSKNIANDLTVPKINIRIGTQYLHRRIRYFNGHVPLALAAYNAGIGNIRGWLKTRYDLGSIDKLISSKPIHELWIDELPWPETTGYIKSILRNYMVYKVLDYGEFDLSDPVWKVAEKE